MSEEQPQQRRSSGRQLLATALQIPPEDGDAARALAQAGLSVHWQATGRAHADSGPPAPWRSQAAALLSGAFNDSIASDAVLGTTVGMESAQWLRDAWTWAADHASGSVVTAAVCVLLSDGKRQALVVRLRPWEASLMSFWKGRRTEHLCVRVLRRR